MASDRYDEIARGLREDHQKTCSDEQLTIRYGLRSAEEAQRLLNARFDERCAAAIRQAVEVEREAILSKCETAAILGGSPAALADWIRARGTPKQESDK